MTFSHLSIGDIVVVCSGKPHFQKERKRVTHVSPTDGSPTFTVAGEIYCMKTGVSQFSKRWPAHLGRTVYLAEGKHLEMAIRGENVKKLSSLTVGSLKKVSNEDLQKAVSLLVLSPAENQ